MRVQPDAGRIDFLLELREALGQAIPLTEGLRQRDHGINEVAADELYNFSLMVTPIQEYGISVPAGGPAGLGETY